MIYMSILNVTNYDKTDEVQFILGDRIVLGTYLPMESAEVFTALFLDSNRLVLNEVLRALDSRHAFTKKQIVSTSLSNTFSLTARFKKVQVDLFRLIL